MGKRITGRISTYVIVPLLCMAVIMGMGVFFTGASSASSESPTVPYTPGQTFIGSNFFTNLNGFVANINQLGGALQRIVPTTGPQFTDLTAYMDTGVALIKTLLGIPILIGSFIYDIVQIFLSFLPTTMPPELLGMIGILALIPIIYILFEIATAIRSPSVGKW
jgi:hypothetical protein